MAISLPLVVLLILARLGCIAVAVVPGLRAAVDALRPGRW